MHYLLKSNGLYYDTSNSSYNTSTKMYDGVPNDEGFDITNWLKTSTLQLENLFIETTIGEETFRPIDKFDNLSIICDENIDLAVQGIKTDAELLVMNTDVMIDNSQIGHINGLNIQGADTNKLVFSFDKGVTWKSYNNGFIDLTTIPPVGNYNDFNADELNQWNTFLNEVQIYGINLNSLSGIDFSSINFDTIRFAYIINREKYNTISTIDKITLSYDELAHLIKAKNNEIDIRRYPKNIIALPLFDTSFAEMRVLTHEVYDTGQEDNRIVLDAPILVVEYSDENKQVSLSWNAVNNCDYYKLYMNGIVIYEGSNLNYVYSIAKRDSYTFAVRAFSNDVTKYIQSDFSNIFTVDLYRYLATANNKYIAIRKNGVDYKFLSKKS